MRRFKNAQLTLPSIVRNRERILRPSCDGIGSEHLFNDIAFLDGDRTLTEQNRQQGRHDACFRALSTYLHQVQSFDHALPVALVGLYSAACQYTLQRKERLRATYACKDEIFVIRPGKETSGHSETGRRSLLYRRERAVDLANDKLVLELVEDGPSR